MKEESNLHILFAGTDLLSQHLWKKHKMIIVNPDKISILDILRHCSREQAVYFLICSPCRLVECDFSRMIVEEGP